MWPYYRLMFQGGLSISLSFSGYDEILSLPEDEAVFLTEWLDQLNQKPKSKQ
jgi:hypothetical protein